MNAKPILTQFLLYMLVMIVICPAARGETIFDGAGTKYGGGTGEPYNPYLIYTAEQMNTIGTDRNDLDKHFRLMADIDLGSFGTEFNVIGISWGGPFSGVFDGNGHSIFNFECGATDALGVGLFGHVRGENAQIMNLRLVNPAINIDNDEAVGSLIGWFGSGTITACSVEGGFVSGINRVGGLVGLNDMGMITECFSATTVSGTTGVGGLVGENFRRIINCYSAGSVSGNEKIGGLVGNAHNLNSITNCYSTARVSGTNSVGGLVGTTNRTKWSFWDIETSGQTESGGGTGKTTAEMQRAGTFIGFWGCDGVWTINEGLDYPRLAWQNMPGELIIRPCYVEGGGTETAPYLIYNAEQLNMIGLFPCDWNKHFKLMADIDMSGYSGTDYNIIGYKDESDSRNDEPFTGVFDGNGRTISNFNYSSNDRESYIGIFLYIDDATLKDLYLVNPNINVDSGEYVGSLVGLSSGTIIACHVQGGSITGAEEVGGIAGKNHGIINRCALTAEVVGNSCVGGLTGNNRGKIIECNSTAKISGHDAVGGLAGYNGYGVISNSYSFGDVTGVTRVGGLVGYSSNQATIINCYSAGRVEGTEEVGGLLGSTYFGKILRCFWDIETSGQTQSAGGQGRTTAEMQTAGTFIGWGPYAVWTINEGHDYPRLLWENMPGELLTTPSYTSIQGSGTDDDPYLIYTAEQLNEIGLFPLEWDKYYKLMADIDLSCYTDINFDTIKNFSGVFDGNGHTISNYSYTCSNGGFFGSVEDAEIKDLGFIDPDINVSSGTRIGLFAGWFYKSTITNCYVQGGSVSGTSVVGGFVGDNYNSAITNSYFQGAVFGLGDVGGLAGWNRGIITDCHFNGEVSGTGRRFGGLAGDNGGGTISNCYATADVSGTNEVGGLVGSQWSGRISDCYTLGSVSGDEQIGGLIGRNNGTIANCCTTSDVSGVTYTGGFAGRNGYNPSDVVWHGNIYNCYARGNVVGDANVGGFAGSNDYFGLINNCYSTGGVSGVEGIGGLVGQDRYGDVIDSFWDIETSGLEVSAGGVGKTTAEMQMYDTFLRWGECGAEGIWTIDEGNDYPRLWWENQPGEVIIFVGFEGAGSKDAPYLIYTAEELNSIGLFPCMWDKHFKLMADIDLGEFVGNLFNIIGQGGAYPWSSDKKPFTGVFDGNGHTISNFNYVDEDVNNVGLFGLVSDPNARIENLGLIESYVSVQNGESIGSLVGFLLGGSVTNCHAENCIVSGGSFVGGIIGRNAYWGGRGVNPTYFGRITNCYSTGSVTGITEVGGLIGANYLGDIVNCFSTSSVTGDSFLGGLIGVNMSSIADCYSTGGVAGNDNIGGLVGYNYRSISNCYSTGVISGSVNAGGFIGYNDVILASVYSSFWDIDTSGQTKSIGGGEGKTTVQMQTESTFTDAGWDFIGETDNGTEDIWWIDEGLDYPRLWWETAEE